jgi:hypothetical protein
MQSPRFLLPCFLLALAGCVTAPDPRESAALAVLKSDAGLREKAVACQQLADFAGPAAVPALASLLAHEQLGDYARSGLESMADPAAGAALLGALETLQGRPRSGVINSLGVRRETAAVSALRRIAAQPGHPAAAEAVGALGLIANPAAAQVLGEILRNGDRTLREAAAHAALIAAERLTAAGQGAEADKLLAASLQAVPAGPAAEAARRQLALRRAG